MLRHHLRAALPAALLAASPALAQDQSGESSAAGAEGYTMVARAAVTDREGAEIGTVTVNETVSGIPLIVIALSEIPEGAHGIHLHEVGDCSADDFSSAGGHIPGDMEHGVYSQNGPHPGDLPNAIVGEDGNMNLEIFNPRLEIQEMLFDEDGSAFIVHDGPDDYTSQPAGDAGPRIACGVFENVSS